jgi:hypothetical protein
MTSSPSPMTNRSTKSASGSGLNVQCPPATTSGSVGERSAERTGTPARSTQLRRFVKTSSALRLNASRSKSEAARCVSTENSGNPRDRSWPSMSAHGAYDRSATASSRSLSSS